MDDSLADFKAWYLSRPLVTRSYLAGCIVLTILVSLGVLNPYALTYTFREAFMGLELWRVFTGGLFMGKFSFGFIFEMMFAYQFISKTESELFSRENYPDFLWLVLWSYLTLLLASSLLPIYFFSKAFVMVITYIYCKRRPHEEIRLMFGFRLKSGIFPFVYMGIMVLLGSSFLPLIIGIGIGHLYIFLKDIIPVRSHKDYLATPQFLQRWWFSRQGVRIPNRPGGPNYGGGVFAGGGVRIG